MGGGGWGHDEQAVGRVGCRRRPCDLDGGLIALSLVSVGGRDLWETEQKRGNLIRVDQASLCVACQVCQQYVFVSPPPPTHFTSVNGSVCSQVISTSGAFSPCAPAVGVGLWPLCAPREDSAWTKQPLKRLREENFTRGTFGCACLPARLQLPPPCAE